MVQASIAGADRRAYSPRMLPRLVHCLALLALLLAPLGMASGHAELAMAPHSATMAHRTDAAGHCMGMDQPSKSHQRSCIDCVIVCSAMATAANEIAAHPMDAAALPRIPLQARIHGLHPESDPPPPRNA